jgi:hypothetical protein
MPNNRFIADFIQETRSDLMSQLVPAGSEAALFMAGVIERGGHLGMLVDQHRKPVPMSPPRMKLVGSKSPMVWLRSLLHSSRISGILLQLSHVLR